MLQQKKQKYQIETKQEVKLNDIALRPMILARKRHINLATYLLPCDSYNSMKLIFNGIEEKLEEIRELEKIIISIQ